MARKAASVADTIVMTVIIRQAMMVQNSDTKGQPTIKKLKTLDKGDSPRNKNYSFTMLSNVCSDVIEGGIQRHQRRE